MHLKPTPQLQIKTQNINRNVYISQTDELQHTITAHNQIR